MDDSMGGDMPMDDAMGGDEEEVIDVEDITNAEEKVNDKVNAVGRDVVKVNHRIDQLLTAIEKMETMIDSNNNSIEALNQEFQKRNPTQTEKLNLRSLDSYPFNVNPVDYWKQKGMTSNYDAYFDNQEPTSKEYVITNNDVDDMTERDMAQSFYVDDDLKQDINKIFGY
jgi:septal ring factor EnvC (AmiA/AmiB activator)